MSTAAVVVSFRALFKQLLRSGRSRPLVTTHDSEWDEADPDDEARTSPTRSRAQPVPKARAQPLPKPVLDCD